MSSAAWGRVRNGVHLTLVATSGCGRDREATARYPEGTSEMMTNSQTKLTAILQGLETDITEITRQIDSTAQQTSQKIRELQVRAEGDQELARSRYGRALDQINVRHSQDLSLAENQWRRDAQWISNVEQKLEQLCAGTVDARSERQAAQLTTKEIDTLKQEILEIIADLESLHAVRSQA